MGPIAPSGSTVDPYRFYSSEPAPMGIADFGLTPADVGYSYASPRFLGTLTIHSMTASLSGNTVVSVQLNTVVVFEKGSKVAAYWIQDVPFIDTSSQQIWFIDNVWNLTGGSMLASSIAGNGSVQTGGFYEATASSHLAGNGVTLTYPAQVSVEVVSSDIGGRPHVGLQYNDGYHWQTYDNVSFPWAAGWTDEGFVVNGLSYTPDGYNFYNAEWVYAGPGGGLSSHNSESNFTLGLSEWNGHNFQAVTNAFDFGSNTAETMSNVAETTSTEPSHGSPVARLSAGSGSLGPLYGRSDVAVLNITPPIANGTIAIGSEVTSFVKGDANLTIFPGTYPLVLRNASGGIGNLRNVTVTAGEYLPLTLNWSPPKYPQPVRFTSMGLPPNTPWWITVNGSMHWSASPNLDLALINGTYPYTVSPMAGYTLPRYSGTLVVHGATNVELNWTTYLLAVSVVGNGLPSWIPWSVLLGNASYPTVNGTAELSLPNGSYPYRIAVTFQFVASPSAGKIDVAGQAVSIDVNFSLRMAQLVGSVSPANATIDVNGTPVNVSAGRFNASLPPGMYELTARALGYYPYSTGLNLSAGNTSTLQLVLTSLPPPPPPTKIPPVTPHNNSTGPAPAPGADVNPWTRLVGPIVVGGALAAAVGLVVVALRRSRHR
jgi:hypothetical protein